MSVRWGCDFCGTVVEQGKKIPDEWYSVYVSGRLDDESGFPRTTGSWDLCPDCFNIFSEYMKGPHGHTSIPPIEKVTSTP